MSHLPITLDALQALDAIDRRGSFAKAAEELDKATSALSYTVQKLEEQLGHYFNDRGDARCSHPAAGCCSTRAAKFSVLPPIWLTR